MSRVAILTKPNNIVFEDRPMPDPGADEVRIRVTAAGVCGTDISIFSGDYKVALPLILGHEYVGIVEAVGSARDEHLIGRRATSEISKTCVARRLADPCPACRRGMPSHCMIRTVIGIETADGAFAEHIVVPAGRVHMIPDEIDDTSAVFIEPLAAAIQTFEMLPPSPGDTIVILGAGRLGSMVCAVASAMSREVPRPPGQLKIIVVDPHEQRRSRAVQLGADAALSPSEGLAGEIRSQTEGLGADIIVEATGRPDGLDLAMQLVRPRGTIALKTTSGLPSPFDQTRLVVQEFRIQGSRCGPFDKAIRFLGEGNIDLSLFDIATFPLDQTQAAIEAARTHDKVIVKP